MNIQDITDVIIGFIPMNTILSFSLTNKICYLTFEKYYKMEEFEKNYCNSINEIVNHDKFKHKIHIIWDIYFKHSTDDQIKHMYMVLFDENLLNTSFDFFDRYDKKYIFDWCHIIKRKKLNNIFIISVINTIKNIFQLWHIFDNISKSQFLNHDTIVEIINIHKQKFTNSHLNNNILNNISKCQNLSYKTINLFENKLNWDLLCEHQKLNEKILRKNIEKINWEKISEYQRLNETFIDEFKDKIHFGKISLNACIYLSDNFINKYSDKLDWFHLTKRKLSKKIIRQNINKILNNKKNNCKYFSVDFILFLKINKLDIDILHQIISQVSISGKLCDLISQHQILNEKITEMNTLYSNELSQHEKIDDSIMEKSNQLKIDIDMLQQNIYKMSIDKKLWNVISQHQKLNEKFIRMYYSHLNWDILSQHQKLRECFIIENKDRVNWNFIYKFQKLSKYFIENYQSEFPVEKCRKSKIKQIPYRKT